MESTQAPYTRIIYANSTNFTLKFDEPPRYAFKKVCTNKTEESKKNVFLNVKEKETNRRIIEAKRKEKQREN